MRAFTDVELTRHQTAFVRVYDDEIEGDDSPADVAWELVTSDAWETVYDDHYIGNSGYEN